MALTGNEVILAQGLDGAGRACSVIEPITTAQIVNLHGSTVGFSNNTATTSTTLTAANLTGGTVEVYLALTGTLGAAANATLPTVAAVIGAAPDLSAGDSYSLRIINESSASYAWTVLTNTGWTLNGTMSIAQNTWRDFVVTFTSNTAATLQAVGTGTHS